MLQSTFLSPLYKIFNQGLFKGLLSVLVPAIFYIVILIIPPPAQVTQAFQSINPVLSIALVLLFSLLFARRGWFWGVASFSIVLILFAMPLVYRWQTGYYDGSVIGGLLPWSDASGYYSEAQRLILGGQFTAFASRRPLFAGFLAVLLSLTGKNLQMTLAILVALNAVACYIAAREIQASHGDLAGAFGFILLFLYYSRYAGLTLTENLGFCLGSLAFTGIWRGARKKQANLVLVGIFVLAMALNARAGAFFILPAMILWGCLFFRGSKLFSFLFFAKAVLVVTVAFILNLTLLKVVGSNEGVAFANYAQTFYGLVSGNKGWYQVYIDYPEIPENEVWGVTLAKFKSNPGLLVTGMAGSYRDYFASSGGAFSFVISFNSKDQILFTRSMWILSGFGILSLIKSRNRTRDSLALFAILGILLSVSLVPPIDADKMRAYAASIPFTIFLAAIGLSFPLVLIKESKVIVEENLNKGKINDKWLAGLGLGLVAISVLGPMIVKITGSPKNLGPQMQCAAKTNIEFYIAPGSYFILMPDSALSESYMPYLRMSDFRRYIRNVPRTYPQLSKELLNIEFNHMVIAGINLANLNDQNDLNYDMFLITNQNPMPGRMYQTCANSTENQWLKTYRFYYSVGQQNGQFHPHGLFFENASLIRNIRYMYGVLFGLVILFAFQQLACTFATTRKQKFLVFACLVLIFNGILVYLHSSGSLAFYWTTKSINTKKIKPVQGFAYSISVGSNWMNQDKIEESPAQVLENNLQLDYPNAMHTSIITVGEGRFSLWDGRLLFSTSDNSDPRTNQRTYTIYWPRYLPAWFLFLSYVCFGISSVILAIFRLRSHPSIT